MDDELRELLDAIDIEFVLDREGITFRETHGRSGRQLNIKSCPFCGNSNWKTYINADTGLGNCFAGSCSRPTFGKWTFLAGVYDQAGRGLVQLLKSLAAEMGWRPKRKVIVHKPDPGSLELPSSIAIADMPEAPDYLLRRGISRDVAAHFNLRVCEEGKFHYTLPNGERGSQDYSQRIIIPIYDLDRRLVTFQGRDMTGVHEKRYLFPPTFAASGAYLYNGFNWRPGMDTAILSEGVFDVIGAQRAVELGGKGDTALAMGTFGIQLSCLDPGGNDQLGRLRELKRHGLRRAIFLWDAEFKAVKKACEGCIELRKIGLEPYVAILPLGLDPGEATPAQIQVAIAGAHRAASKLDLFKILKIAKESLGNT